jgi:hypothetical protein
MILVHQHFPGDIVQSVRISNRSTMKDDKDRWEGQSGKPAKEARQDRLRQALRENLKRRKSQAKGRDAFTMAPSSADNVPPYDESQKATGE